MDRDVIIDDKKLYEALAPDLKNTVEFARLVARDLRLASAPEPAGSFHRRALNRRDNQIAAVKGLAVHTSSPQSEDLDFLAALARWSGKYTNYRSIYQSIWTDTDALVGVFGDGANGAYEWFIWRSGKLRTSDVAYGSDYAALRDGIAEVERAEKAGDPNGPGVAARCLKLGIEKACVLRSGHEGDCEPISSADFVNQLRDEWED